jgi:hypothetical protein
MPTITWKHRCYFCHRSIIGGKPSILFATDKPMLFGVSHFKCVPTKYHLGDYHMKPPCHLSQEHVAFLIQFYPMMCSLPAGIEPNAALRHYVVDFLWNYPESAANQMKCLREFREQNQDEGDLEADYLMF